MGGARETPAGVSCAEDARTERDWEGHRTNLCAVLDFGNVVEPLAVTSKVDDLVRGPFGCGGVEVCREGGRGEEFRFGRGGVGLRWLS